MSDAHVIRVLSVDDHPMVRDGIAFALSGQQDMELVAEATNGREAVCAYEAHRPHVTLMDLQMPLMNGIQAIATIRQVHPAAKIIVLTTYSGDVQAARAFKAGAVGYLLKDMLRKDLIETIRAVYRGARIVPPEIANELAEHLGYEGLTDREIEVLRSVSGGRSNKIVASHLGVSEDTIKTHMRNILEKLHANDRTHAVLIAIHRGFLDA
jgi:DNA-binding NarL/FixJ family response regulator